jgi:protein-ribulosamine 3-kinase
VDTTIRSLGDGLHRLALEDGRRAIVKRRRSAPPGFYAMEAHGLALLHAAQALRVPAVYFVSDDALVIEDLGDGRPSEDAWQRAGRGLARIHANCGEAFGLDRDGWCGASPQPNTPTRDGWQFFAERRLLFQGRRAFDARRLGKPDLDALERLCACLPSRIPAQPPVLVHGDLWTANLHACADGELALIDAAAVHHGWAEADLAMLTLFGEPPAEFFAAYQEAAAIDTSWRARAALYNLYHLLNHLNLFGPGYLGAVRSVLRGH